MVAAGDRELPDLAHHELRVRTVPDEHVVQVQERRVRREGPGQTTPPLVVRVAQPALAEQAPEGCVVPVGVEVARHDGRSVEVPGLAEQVPQPRTPQAFEHRDRRQGVHGEQPYGHAADVDRRARQRPAPDRAGAGVPQGKAAEQPDGLVAALRLGDGVGQVLQEPGGPQAGQPVGVQLGHHEHVRLQRPQRTTGPGRVGVEHVEVGDDHPQPRCALDAGGQRRGAQGRGHDEQVGQHQGGGHDDQRPAPDQGPEHEQGVRRQQRQRQRADQQRQHRAVLAADRSDGDQQHQRPGDQPGQDEQGGRERPPVPPRGGRRPLEAAGYQLSRTEVSSTQSTAFSRRPTSKALAWCPQNSRSPEDRTTRTNA